MSLGFLTESALVPSKAKSIKVDSKSLVDLQAVIYKKEQERRKNAENPTRTATTLRGKRGAKNTLKSESTKKNGGIEKRKQKDEEDEGLGDDERGKMKRSRQILIEKAKLYDELAKGTKVLQSKEQTLIDFNEKNTSRHKDHEFIDGMKAIPSSKPLTMEVQDEFGRTITVPFIAASKNDANDVSNNTSSFVVSQWERTLKEQEKGYLNQVHEETKLAKITLADKNQRKQARLSKLKQALGTATETTVHAAPQSTGTVSNQASLDASAFLSNFM